MNDSTKEKILTESHKLFAEKGYNGVSVREIANQCGVNIAAINYHFKNKENLYVEVFKQSIMDTQKDIQRIYDELPQKKIEDFTVKVYQHFVANSEDLRMSFKMVLSPVQFDRSFEDLLSEYPGPPGGMIMHQCILKENPKADEEDVKWAVRVIFSLVMHKAILTCNSSICSQLSEHQEFDDHTFEEDLRRTVQIVIKDIKKD